MKKKIGISAFTLMLFFQNAARLYAALDPALIIYDAGKNPPAELKCRTKSWVPGNFRPEAEKVIIDNAPYAHITCTGDSGEAQILFTITEEHLKAVQSVQYDGIKVGIRYDKENAPIINFRVWAKGNKRSVGYQPQVLQLGYHEYKFRASELGDIEFFDISVRAGDQKNLEFYFDKVYISVKAELNTGARQSSHPVLIPRVKKAAWKNTSYPAANYKYITVPDNATARTRRTAELFNQKFSSFMGYPLQPVKDMRSNIIKLAIKQPVNEQVNKEQGYYLSINQDHVMLEGNDEQGLYYACTTFFQVLTASYDPRASRQIFGVEIHDWPDCRQRALKIFHPGHWSKEWKFKTSITYDDLVDFTERYVIGLKNTHFFPDFSSCVNYKSVPALNLDAKFFSLDDLRRFAVFCRDNFIEVGACIELGSHAGYSYLRYFPELADKDFPAEANLEHPQHWNLVTAMISDFIDSMQIKYFSPGSDEYYFHPLKGTTPSAEINGKSRAQSFLDFHLKLYKWLKDRGIKMFMYSDMLDQQMGGKRFDLYKTLDSFPKDIIMCPWHDLGNSVECFSAKGWPVWIINTYWNSFYKSRTNIYGFGVAAYGYGPKRHFFPDNDDNFTRLDKVFLSADYSWNLAEEKNPNIYEEVENGFLGNAFTLLSVRPNPRAGISFEPLPLDALYSHSLKAYLLSNGIALEELTSDARQIIANVPMQLTADEKNSIVIDPGALKTIPVGKKFSSIFFLHSLLADKKLVSGSYSMPDFWPIGLIAGQYTLRYDDGSSFSRLIANDKNINTITENPYTLNPTDCRYVWKIDKKKEAYFYQYEFINPFPDKTIRAVEIKHLNYYKAGMIILALTGLDVNKK
ncbi:MAG: hypothetical protein A2096_12985 [Spirochaetes bacterium GWF1_41_5]|nr:MAG: hypothetical protein A2096_12985 [Spirochaetes bacterium GWF1_41_5]